jgi:DNA primase
MSAEAIATALGGRKAGAAWMACCPAHQDRDPSLAITDSRDGKVLVRCHAGCDQRDVIAALRARGLADPGDVLMIGEGIETCLAAVQATGHAAWAALSTSGLRGLDLPPELRDVIVLADGDDPGEAAARDCAQRWKREGRRLRIARPPVGLDFNDLLGAMR